MSFFSFTLIAISVSLSVLAQILLKQGMSGPAMQTAISDGAFSFAKALTTNFFVIAGLFAYVASAGVWLSVLARVDVSKAYPFVGLGFIGTMLFAYWFLHEPLSLNKVIGTLLIVLGVLFISN